MASGISPVLESSFLAEHARVPGILAPLLVDEPVQPPDWDTSREAVDRRTFGPSEAAGCWEGGESDEGGCTPAWSLFASEAPAAARRRAAAITLLPMLLSRGARVSRSAACNTYRFIRQEILQRCRLKIH